MSEETEPASQSGKVRDGVKVKFVDKVFLTGKGVQGIRTLEPSKSSQACEKGYTEK